MRFNILTIFPDIILSYCNESILKRGQEAGVISVRAINIRDFSNNKHNTVDDSPYGGGAGMVMKPEPIYRALASLDALTSAIGKQTSGVNKLKMILKSVVGSPKSKRTILLSPRGRQFDQRLAEEWSALEEITFVCGRYEGVDQRVVDHMVDEEVSIGSYVLAGGELGALVMVEAVARLIPGVLGNPESLREETHSEFQISDCRLQINNDDTCSKSKIKNQKSEIQKEYPHYTKPAEFNGWKVPAVLLSGDHKKIAEWRRAQVQS